MFASEPKLPLPTPDQVRYEIDRTDERARLLRRLLRLVVRLQVNTQYGPLLVPYEKTASAEGGMSNDRA